MNAVTGRIVSRSVIVLLLALSPFACRAKARSPAREGLGVQESAASAAVPAAQATAIDSDAIVKAANSVLPAVVSVASTRVAIAEAPELPDDPFFRRFFGPGPFQSPFPFPRGGERIERGLGSGVIVGPDVILTNAHVVEGAKELEITGQNKRRLKAKVVGTDEKSDLAVLKIEGDVSGLTPLPFAESSKLRLGQVVLAVGNPFGVGQTVTMGIVSATSRADLGIETYEDFIQTDAAINPGNSGGALVDLEGRLVGIPTAILSRTGGYMGVGFAIPSDMAQPIMKSLLEHGRVERGFLGVTIQNLDPDLAAALGIGTLDGVLISGVQPGGPAAKAGIRRGDVVLSVEGKAVQSTGQFRNLIASSPIGNTVRLEILRGKDKQTVTPKIERLPPDDDEESTKTPPKSDGSAGLALGRLDGALREKLSVPPSVQGVVVTGVRPASAADRAGLRPGDVIVEAGGAPVRGPEEFVRRFRSAKGPLALLVWRQQGTFYVVLKR